MSFANLTNVTRRYTKGEHAVTPLEGVNLSIEAGEFFVLLGPSGSGKTTLLNLLAGIDEADEGRIEVAGTDLTAASSRQLARWRSDHIGYVFQQANLVPVLTAYENVDLPLWLLPLSRQERHQRVSLALEAVGLTDRAHHRPGQLSGVKKSPCRCTCGWTTRTSCCGPRCSCRPGSSERVTPMILRDPQRPRPLCSFPLGFWRARRSGSWMEPRGWPRSAPSPWATSEETAPRSSPD